MEVIRFCKLQCTYNAPRGKAGKINKPTGKDMSKVPNKIDNNSEGVNNACHFLVVMFGIALKN
jgi:hypothetical protein